MVLPKLELLVKEHFAQLTGKHQQNNLQFILEPVLLRLIMKYLKNNKNEINTETRNTLLSDYKPYAILSCCIIFEATYWVSFIPSSHLIDGLHVQFSNCLNEVLISLTSAFGFANYDIICGRFGISFTALKETVFSKQFV